MSGFTEIPNTIAMIIAIGSLFDIDVIGYLVVYFWERGKWPSINVQSQLVKLF
jgi:hypothetical protein